MSLKVPRDRKLRITSERTRELLAEIVVPAVGEPRVTGQYAGTLDVISETDGVSIGGYLEDSRGRVLALRDGVSDYVAAGLVTIEQSRADGTNVQRIGVRPTREAP